MRIPLPDLRVLLVAAALALVPPALAAQVTVEVRSDHGPPAEAREAEADGTAAEVVVEGTDAGVARAMAKLRRGVGKGDRDRVAFGSSIVVEAGEEVKDVVAFGGTVTVKEGAVVRGDAVAFGGTVDLRPGVEVRGDVVAFGGSVIVRSGAAVRGDTVSFGGAIDVEDGAMVRGSRVGMGAGGVARDLADTFGDDGGGGGGAHERSWIAETITGALSTTAMFLVTLVVGFLCLVVMPRRVDRMRRPLVTAPGKSLGVGLLATVSLLPLTIMLAITGIGILLIPILWALFCALLFAGWVVAAMWVGRRFGKPSRRTPAMELFVGLALLWIVGVATEVPYLGIAAGVALVVTSFFGMGSVMLSRFGNAPPPTSASVWPPPEATTDQDTV